MLINAFSCRPAPAYISSVVDGHGTYLPNQCKVGAVQLGNPRLGGSMGDIDFNRGVDFCANSCWIYEL